LYAIVYLTFGCGVAERYGELDVRCTAFDSQSAAEAIVICDQ